MGQRGHQSGARQLTQNGATVVSAGLLAVEQMPKLWLEMTRPSRASRFKKQSKLQRLFATV
jgi:hypothetical protein